MGKKNVKKYSDNRSVNILTRGIVEFLIALAAGLASGGFSFAAIYYNSKSELAKRCHNLEGDVKARDAKIEAKNEKIHDLELHITELKNDLRAKDLLANSKENLIELYRSSLYENKGICFTNQSDIINHIGGSAKTTTESRLASTNCRLTGSLAQRLGLKEEWSIREKIEKGWSRELWAGTLPGVYLPAPSDMCSTYLRIFDAKMTNDFKQAVKLARELQVKISQQLDPHAPHGGVTLDIRYAIIASDVFEIVAEDEFANGNYTQARFFIRASASVLGVKPPPRILAKESAIIQKADGYKCGFFTQYMADAIQSANNDDYRFELLSECARLGCLQLYMPSSDGKGIGQKIDWTIFDPKRRPLPLRKVIERDGKLWSTRWCGLDKQEAYCITDEMQKLRISDDVIIRRGQTYY